MKKRWMKNVLCLFVLAGLVLALTIGQIGIGPASAATVPSITSLVPGSGVLGASVTVNGSGFGAAQGSGYVSFGTTKAFLYASWTDTRIVCSVPSGVSGVQDVSVTTEDGTSPGVPFGVLPNLSGLSPTSGSAGTGVTLFGSAFGATQGASYVSFGSTRATDYTAWSDGQVVCLAPPGYGGTRVVTITTAGGTSGIFPFTLAGGIIASVQPTSAQQGQTLDVAIAGNETGFTAGTSVASFGAGITVNALAVADATHASANITVSPSAAVGARDVTVTTGPDVASPLPDGFTVTARPLAPSIDGVTPPSGAVGDAVTIRGADFGATRGSSFVSFGPVTASDYHSWSGTAIVCKVPAGAASGPVSVTTYAGTSNQVSFTVVVPGSGNTPAGKRVKVRIDEATSVLFLRVRTAGNTTSVPGPDPKVEHYRVISGSRRTIGTTAVFQGMVRVTLAWKGEGATRLAEVRVLHLEKGRWVDRTTRHDQKARTVSAWSCSLGDYVLAVRVPGKSCDR
jgi:hypothetical protein